MALMSSIELAEKHAPEAAEVLGKAALRAAQKLGLTRAELSQAIGRDRSSISRGGIPPETKAGELAALVVRCYRSLAVLLGGDETQIQAWMATANRHTGGVPREQVLSVAGLVRVCGYLDAIRGHG